MAVVMGMAHYFCRAEPIHLIELRDALLGLQQAANFRPYSSKVWIELDSELGMNWINKKSRPPWLAFPILSHIWHMLSIRDEFKVTHIWREAN